MVKPPKDIELKRVVITQSNYIPWKGYFDAIALADEFIFLDEVQYTKRDWRNRNQIKTPQGLLWLTIPVNVKGKVSQTIWETTTVSDEWKVLHWKTIQANYARASAFQEIGPKIHGLYETCPSENLSLINFHFIKGLNELLNIKTPMSWSHDYTAKTGKTVRLVDICEKAGATDYFTGPAAKAYLDEKVFSEAKIKVHYFDYSGYPSYRQLHGEFTHNVSVIDLLMNEGSRSQSFLNNISG